MSNPVTRWLEESSSIIGAVISGVAGSREDSKTRWRVAGETTLVAILSVVLFMVSARYFSNVIIGAVIALVPIVLAKQWECDRCPS